MIRGTLFKKSAPQSRPSFLRIVHSRMCLRNTISHLPTSLLEVGKAYGLPTRVLGDPPANEEVFNYIPIDSARHYGFVPLDKVDGALEVGITDPDNIEALDALQFISGKIGIPYKIFLITEQDLNRVIEAYQNLSGEVGRALSEYETTVKPRPPPARAPAGSAPGKGWPLKKRHWISRVLARP